VFSNRILAYASIPILILAFLAVMWRNMEHYQFDDHLPVERWQKALDWFVKEVKSRSVEDQDS